MGTDRTSLQPPQLRRITEKRVRQIMQDHGVDLEELCEDIKQKLMQKGCSEKKATRISSWLYDSFTARNQTEMGN